jgi:sulfur dioxygenase
MIFKQLFEPVSSTYTYLLGCEETGQAVLVDPVINAMDRDMQVLQELGLRLAYTLDTHIHADHITSALELKKRTGSRIAAPAIDRLPCVDFGVEEATPLAVGSLGIRGLHTPGHTDGHFSYVLGDRVFTGDALLIDGCGRTDFQNGDSRVLFDSVTHKLFALPGETLVYPAHDYSGRHVSSIAQEKTRNPRPGWRQDAGRVHRHHGVAEPALSEVHRPRGAWQQGLRRVPDEPAAGAAEVLRADGGEPARVSLAGGLPAAMRTRYRASASLCSSSASIRCSASVRVWKRARSAASRVCVSSATSRSAARVTRRCWPRRSCWFTSRRMKPRVCSFSRLEVT